MLMVLLILPNYPTHVSIYNNPLYFSCQLKKPELKEVEYIVEDHTEHGRKGLTWTYTYNPHPKFHPRLVNVFWALSSDSLKLWHFFEQRGILYRHHNDFPPTITWLLIRELELRTFSEMKHILQACIY